MRIQTRLISKNVTKGRKDHLGKAAKIEYIVIHDTGNTGKNAGIDNHFKYFNGENRNASAHYFVENQEVGQFVQDSDTAWHVGDGVDKNTKKPKYGISNANSIGIERCINPEANPQTTMNTMVELTQKLMKTYNIPIDRVVRHYDASRKPCPNSLKGNDWAEWKQFIQKVKSGSAPGCGCNCHAAESNPSQPNTGTSIGVVTCDTLNVRSGRGTQHSVIGKLKRGEEVRLSNKVEDWWSIYYGSNGGWVHADYIRIK